MFNRHSARILIFAILLSGAAGCSVKKAEPLLPPASSTPAAGIIPTSGNAALAISEDDWDVETLESEKVSAVVKKLKTEIK